MTVLLEGGVGEGKARDACGVEWVEGGGGSGGRREGGALPGMVVRVAGDRMTAGKGKMFLPELNEAPTQ